jgi:hypothetical protein
LEAPFVSDIDPAEVTPRSVRVVPEKLRSAIVDSLDSPAERRDSGVREGLPPGYRMRADAHYVDQLTAPSSDLSIQYVATEELESDVADDPMRLLELTHSIATHGVVQPLLVRRDDTRYRLIAGRKRLAAARAAGLVTVPCLVCQADDERAASLAEADNLRIASAEEPSAARSLPRSGFWPAQLSQDVAAIESAAALLTAPLPAHGRRAAIDMIRAQAWRASWLLASVELENTGRDDARFCLLGSLLERTREGFLPESRLSGIELQVWVPDRNVSALVDDRGLMVGLTGGILATLGLMERSETGVITLIAAASAGEPVTIDIAQETAAVPVEASSRFFDSAWTDRPGGWLAAAGALAAKTVARQHGGDALFLPRERRGSTLRVTLDHAR